MIRDWTGNNTSVFSTLGASNHSNDEREPNDYYATDPSCVEELLKREQFSNIIWEPAVGEGHIADVLTSHGYEVVASDIVDRGYPKTEILDFLENDATFDGDIITNPPYKYAKNFVEQSLNATRTGGKVAMLLKLTFLEGLDRRKLFDVAPPKTVYVFSKRQKCAKNGDFEHTPSSAVAYAWFVWEKGYLAPPTLNGSN